jgi:alpha-tubulin suppressor-like RCC1 family protein
MSLAPSGLLFAWGSNFFGQLGIAQAAAVDVPKFLDTPTVVEKLRPGYNNNNNQSSNANVNVDVNVNLSGQGTGREGDAVEVEGEGEGEVEGMVPIQMSCGASHSLVLCEGKMKGNSSRAVRTVWVMGCGSSGQLGTGGSSTTYAPTLLDLDTHINAANTTNTTNPRASDSDSDSAAGGGDAEKDKTKTKTSRVRARADPIAVSTGGPLSMHSYVFTSGVNLARAPLPKLDLATLLALIRRLRDNPGKSKSRSESESESEI